MCPNQSVCSFPQIPFPSQFLPARENLSWTLRGAEADTQGPQHSRGHLAFAKAILGFWNGLKSKRHRSPLKEDGRQIYTRCLQKRLSQNTNSNPSRRHWPCPHPGPSQPLTHVCGVHLWELKLQSPVNMTVKVTSVQGYRCKMACDSLLVWGHEDPYLFWLLGTLCSCHSWCSLGVWYSPPYWGEEAFPVPMSATHRWLPSQSAPSGETPQWWRVGCVSVIHPPLECPPTVEKHTPYTVHWDKWPILGSVWFFFAVLFCPCVYPLWPAVPALLVIMN